MQDLVLTTQAAKQSTFDNHYFGAIQTHMISDCHGDKLLIPQNTLCKISWYLEVCAIYFTEVWYLEVLVWNSCQGVTLIQIRML